MEVYAMKNKFRNLFSLSALACGSIWASNTIIEKKAVSKHLLTSSEENFYSWKNLNIFFTRKGIGTPVILLHDLTPESCSYEWTNVVDKLSENHKVYTFDLLGCGRSDKPEITYTNFYYVEILISFIKSQICEKTYVIASGYSSVVALMAAAYDPSKFSGITFINPPSIGEMARVPSVTSKISKKMMQCPLFGSMIYNIHYSRDSIDNRFTEQYFYNPFRMTTQLIDCFYESAHIQGSKGRYLEASLAGRYLNMNIRHALKKLKVPSSILYGSNMRNEVLIAASWKKVSPALQIAPISQSKRYPHFEKPAETTAKLERMIQDSLNVSQNH